jgi:DNA-binding response OmpR family regulator
VSANAPKPRILVIEDDAPMRAALAAALAGGGYEVRPEPDGSAFEAVVASFRPDLAILDVHLSVGPDGYAIARRLRAAGELPVVFLTAADGYGPRKAGFDAGGDDYLVKPFPLEELLWRVRALLRRSGRLSSSRLEVGDLIVDEGAGMAIRAGEALDLTATEQRLLCALAGHPGQILSKYQLLAQVWNSDAYDPNVVEVHMSSLRQKLEARGPRLIHTVRGAGYVARA